MLLYSVLNNKTTINSDYLGETIYNLLDETFSLPQNFDYNIFTVPEEYIARPDLLSLDAYGSTMYADVICKINGISNPFELNEGDKLILPTPDYILDFAKNPEVTEEIGEENNDIIIKTKSDKRKPNEAILGDTRFRVDPVTGVIIY